MSLRADLLVQVCIENTGPSEGSMAAGTATATLDADFPGGASRTVATVDAATGHRARAEQRHRRLRRRLRRRHGTLPRTVTAADTVFFEQADLPRTATITGSTALAPFIGDGTIDVTYTPESDTELSSQPIGTTSPSPKDNSKRPSPTPTPRPPTSAPNCPAPASDSNRIVTIAVITLLLGLTAVLVAQYRRRHQAPPTDAI